jgi:nitroimidazol reductase NimA-like FMN-containing flavoprotein (pyridoxamine 5'-phosphate oxidase superfamily)
MDQTDYVYTTGMNEDEVEEKLRAGEHGVLSLAADNDAYATPLSYHYDGDRLLLRVSTHDGGSKKQQFLETTDTATFVCHEATTRASWSIHVRGPISEWKRNVDEATLNEWFPPFRLFDEAIEDVQFVLYELEMETAIGRKTVKSSP